MGNEKLSVNMSKRYLPTKGALKIQEKMMNWKISGTKIHSLPKTPAETRFSPSM